MGDGSAGRFDPKGKGRANGDVLAMDLGSAEEGTAGAGSSAFMQMQLVEQQVRSHNRPEFLRGLTVHRTIIFKHGQLRLNPLSPP